MLREFAIAGAGTALVVGLSGCGGNALTGRPAAAAVAPASAAPAASTDPYAPKLVAYHEYRDAAMQMSIRANLLSPMASFRAGLDKLCHTPPDGFAQLRRSQRLLSRADPDPTSALQSRTDETALRVDMACPQRMADWTTAREAVDQNADAGSDASGTATPTPDPTPAGSDGTSISPSQQAGPAPGQDTYNAG